MKKLFTILTMAVMLSCSTDDDNCLCTAIIANYIEGAGGSFVIEGIETNCIGGVDLDKYDLPEGSYVYELLDCVDE